NREPKKKSRSLRVSKRKVKLRCLLACPPPGRDAPPQPNGKLADGKPEPSAPASFVFSDSIVSNAFLAPKNSLPVYFLKAVCVAALHHSYLRATPGSTRIARRASE